MDGHSDGWMKWMDRTFGIGWEYVWNGIDEREVRRGRARGRGIHEPHKMLNLD